MQGGVIMHTYKKGTAQTEPLVSEENVRNPLIIDDTMEVHGTYTPPSLPGTLSAPITRLSDVKDNYNLTKKEAEQLMIIEPQSGAPMSLFHYMLHVIEQERLRRVSDTTYGHDRTVKQQFIQLYQKTNEAGPEANIKELLRNELNSCDLKSYCYSLQKFWLSVRSALNEKINFQPLESTIRPMYDADEMERQKKNSSFLVRSGFEKPIQIDHHLDVCNATGIDIQHEVHEKVETDIQALMSAQLLQREEQMEIKANLMKMTGRRAPTPPTDDDDSDDRRWKHPWS